jgi:hypothetical protein
MPSLETRERAESEPVVETEGDGLGEVVSGGGRDMAGDLEGEHVGELGGDAAA